MSRFNTTTSTKTTNYEGGSAYSQTPEHELYLMACSCMLDDKFYESEYSQLQRLRDLMKKVDPEFSAKLIMYVREQMNLRSVTHVMAAELAHFHKGKVSEVIQRICKRPDDMTEILAYQLQEYGKPIPNQMKKGLARAFQKFDEYQLQKWS